MNTPATNATQRQHAAIKWTAIVCGSVVAAVVLVLVFFDWNLLRTPLARRITEETGRPASIDGKLTVHLWSTTPTVILEGLKIGNPPWADKPLMLDLPRLTIKVSLARLLAGSLVLTQVEADAPEVDLERDAKGRASWDFESPDNKGKAEKNREASGKLPAMRRLDINHGRLAIDDRIRQLDLKGTVSADERQGGQGGFRLQGSGSLNGKPFKVNFTGSPLIDIVPDQTYAFESSIVAGDLELRAHVSIPRPFDLRELQARFTLTGTDLANVYYLTGLALPNTPPYRVEANLHRVGTVYHIEQLHGTLGHSDIGGNLDLDTARQRPRLTGTLTSQSLNFADLAAPLGHPVTGAGSGAAPTASATRTPGQASTPAPTKAPISAPISAPTSKSTADTEAAPGAAAAYLLPDADLQLNRVRGMDADVTYAANSVVARAALPLHEVHVRFLLDDGLLQLDPLSFVLRQGQFAGAVRIDARGAIPVSAIDMRLTQVDLAEFKGASTAEAPIGGLIHGRMQLHGAGASIHKFAADSNGAVSLVIPSGDIREALAELTGINVLSGLGLLVSGNTKQVEVRCGVADFEAANGVLSAKTFVLDTSNVLITGKGEANLGSERLDFSLQGRPKSVRLVRLRSPIKLDGTLLKPSIGISPAKLLEQAGEATALGLVLTPVAAVLAFVDPGLAKDANCAALQQESAQLQNSAQQQNPAQSPPAAQLQQSK
jgi:uncharacterized protein involved in outer membrane biogenesis